MSETGDLPLERTGMDRGNTAFYFIFSIGRVRDASLCPFLFLDGSLFFSLEIQSLAMQTGWFWIVAAVINPLSKTAWIDIW